MHANLHTHIQAHYTYASSYTLQRQLHTYSKTGGGGGGGGAEREAKRQIDSWIYLFFSRRPQVAEAAPPCTAKHGVGGDCNIHSIEP